jgi:hypothetical protein
MDDHKKAQESWERFLNPDELRPTLMLSSIYISTFEILKDVIISRIKDFYWRGFDENGDIIDPKYQSDVLAKNSSPLYASILWLKEAEAISDSDIELFNQIKKRRNDIAHEMFRMLSEGLPVDFAERFNDMVSLVSKIEKWWIINVELETGPIVLDSENKLVEVNIDDIDLDGIIPGPIASLRMLIDIAIGTDEQSRYYFNEFIKATHKNS